MARLLDPLFSVPEAQRNNPGTILAARQIAAGWKLPTKASDKAREQQDRIAQWSEENGGAKW